MRSAVSVAILVSASFLLAGCSGDKGKEDFHYVCANGLEIHGDDHPTANSTADLAKYCPKSSTSGSKTNTTSQAPNVLPTLVLTVTDDNGTPTPVTLLDGNLTFSAVGSTDSDGSIAGIAVTVTDSNTTRTATLYDAAKKEFKDATFSFDRAGPVNVTVAMVDDRAGFVVNQTKVYVNQLVTKSGGAIQLPSGGQALPGMDACEGGDNLVEAPYFKTVSIDVVPGATRIDVTAGSGGDDALMTICAADFTRLSDEKVAGMVSTLPGVVIPTPSGTTFNFVGVYSDTAQGMDTDVSILVHYEPQAAAAA
jgi:hypothetical protein